MFKITSIFSREWQDVVGYILQTHNPEEYFLCIPSQYWDKFYLGAEHKSANVDVTESDGFHTVPCAVDLGNLHFGLKSGDFKLNVHPDTILGGYVRLEVDCPLADPGHIVIQHLVEGSTPISEVLKQLHNEITLPRKPLTEPPNTTEEIKPDEVIRKELETEFEQHREYIVKLLEHSGLKAQGDVTFDTIESTLGNAFHMADIGRYEMGDAAAVGYTTDGTLV